MDILAFLITLPVTAAMWMLMLIMQVILIIAALIERATRPVEG